MPDYLVHSYHTLCMSYPVKLGKEASVVENVTRVRFIHTCFSVGLGDTDNGGHSVPCGHHRMEGGSPFFGISHRTTTSCSHEILTRKSKCGLFI